MLRYVGGTILTLQYFRHYYRYARLLLINNYVLLSKTLPAWRFPGRPRPVQSGASYNTLCNRG